VGAKSGRSRVGGPRASDLDYMVTGSIETRCLPRFGPSRRGKTPRPACIVLIVDGYKVQGDLPRDRMNEFNLPLRTI
jgi:hypothetical protein